jgi:hypothetical protein
MAGTLSISSRNRRASSIAIDTSAIDHHDMHQAGLNAGVNRHPVIADGQHRHRKTDPRPATKCRAMASSRQDITGLDMDTSQPRLTA